MSTKAGFAHDTLAYRLSAVLTKLNQGESLDPKELADEFGVNLRTIQRDLNVRFAGLPLIKANGRYKMDEAHLDIASEAEADIASVTEIDLWC